MSKRIPLDDDLLADLNDAANYIIGNVNPEDVSFNGNSTLPESLSYVMIYSNTDTAVKDAIKKMKILQDKIDIIHKKLRIIENKNKVRRIDQ